MKLLRILSRLLLALVTVVATAHPSSCSAIYTASAGVQAELGCCCVAADADTCGISNGSCCSASNEKDQAPTNSGSATDISSDAAATGKTIILPLEGGGALAAKSAGAWRDLHRKPLHLASNKVYLEKRSLLI